jgi:hypothetical protein
MQMLAAVVRDRLGDGDGSRLLASLLQLGGALVIIIANGAIIHAVNDVASAKPSSFSRSLDAALERFVPLLTTNLLASVLEIASLIAFPYFFIRWTFNPQAVMIDAKRNWAALDASAAAVKGRWWRTLGVLIVVLLICIAPMLPVSFAALLPVLPATTILSIALALILPFFVTAQTLLYFDLKARQQADDRSADGLPFAQPDVPGEGA